MPIRGKTNKQANKNSALISPCKKLTQATGETVEGRNQKEERIHPWSLGKGALKHNNNNNNNNEKTEKYYTNEGINWKHRCPNKWRGNSLSTWKKIQHNDSKDDKKPWKQNGEDARINYQRPRRIKEYTCRDKQHNYWN